MANENTKPEELFTEPIPDPEPTDQEIADEDNDLIEKEYDDPDDNEDDEDNELESMFSDPYANE
jgi:hypothetical protein